MLYSDRLIQKINDTGIIITNLIGKFSPRIYEELGKYVMKLDEIIDILEKYRFHIIHPRYENYLADLTDYHYSLFTVMHTFVLDVKYSLKLIKNEIKDNNPDGIKTFNIIERMIVEKLDNIDYLKKEIWDKSNAQNSRLRELELSSREYDSIGGSNKLHKRHNKSKGYISFTKYGGKKKHTKRLKTKKNKK